MLFKPLFMVRRKISAGIGAFNTSVNYKHAKPVTGRRLISAARVVATGKKV